MYANVLIVRHKSEEDLAEATRREQRLSSDLAAKQGFRHAYHIRIGELDALHIAVFDSEEDSRAAFASLGPRMAEAMEPHMAGPPQVLSGDVLFEIP
jgi:hypothetical protein